ncbi:MAG: DHHA1 domain-containing protein, partial [Patescibacteria group bacterium]
SSTAELMYLVLTGLGVNLNKSMSQNLLAGIIADTGAFQFSNVTSQTLAIAQKLMGNGADRWEIILNVFKSLPFNKLKFWGEILKEMEWDKEHKFVWSAVAYDIYKEFAEPISAKESAATLFAAIVKDTDFGMIMVEEEKGVLSVSLRGRTNFDVSRIAEKLGGGGHRSAAGAKVYGKDFDGAIIKVLEIARKTVNESKN